MNVRVSRMYLQEKSKENLKSMNNCQIIFSELCFFLKYLLKPKRILDSIKDLSIFIRNKLLTDFHSNSANKLVQNKWKSLILF